MKKILTLALAVMMVAALALTASAYFIDNNSSGATITYTIPQAYAEHKLDGVITEGEYAKLEVKTEYLSIATYDEDAAMAQDFDNIGLWMSYDANYLYVAATTTAKDFHNACDDNTGSIWGQYAIQLSLADVDNDEASERLETGYALSSETGALLFANWCDGTGDSYDALEANDFIVTNANGILTYECRVPFSAFSSKTLVEGSQFRFCIVWATGTSEDDGTSEYRHLQLAYGCTGDPGKDVTGHAVITMGAALEAPVVDTPAADDAPAADAPATTAPTTADAGIVAAAAVMAIAAGVVLSKKH